MKILLLSIFMLCVLGEPKIYFAGEGAVYQASGNLSSFNPVQITSNVDPEIKLTQFHGNYLYFYGENKLRVYDTSASTIQVIFSGFLNSLAIDISTGNLYFSGGNDVYLYDGESFASIYTTYGGCTYLAVKSESDIMVCRSFDGNVTWHSLTNPDQFEMIEENAYSFSLDFITEKLYFYRIDDTGILFEYDHNTQEVTEIYTQVNVNEHYVAHDSIVYSAYRYTDFIHPYVDFIAFNISGQPSKYLILESLPYEILATTHLSYNVHSNELVYLNDAESFSFLGLLQLNTGTHIKKWFFSPPFEEIEAIGTYNGNVYYLENEHGYIGKITPTTIGSSPFKGDLVDPLGHDRVLAIDSSDGDLFVSSSFQDISKWDVTYSGNPEVFSSFDSYTSAVVNPATKDLYVTHNSGLRKIGSSNTDIFLTKIASLIGLAYDGGNNKIYWVEYSGKVKRANDDGTGFEVLFTQSYSDSAMAYNPDDDIIYVDSYKTVSAYYSDGTLINTCTTPGTIGHYIYYSGYLYIISDGTTVHRWEAISNTFEELVDHGVDALRYAIDIHIEKNLLYYFGYDSPSARIYTYNLTDGTSQQIGTYGGSLYHMAVDSENDHLYLHTFQDILRCDTISCSSTTEVISNIDSTNRVISVKNNNIVYGDSIIIRKYSTTDYSPVVILENIYEGFRLDRFGDIVMDDTHLYFVESELGYIYRCNHDGTNIEAVYTSNVCSGTHYDYSLWLYGNYLYFHENCLHSATMGHYDLSVLDNDSQATVISTYPLNILDILVIDSENIDESLSIELGTTTVLLVNTFHDIDVPIEFQTGIKSSDDTSTDSTQLDQSSSDLSSDGANSDHTTENDVDEDDEDVEDNEGTDHEFDVDTDEVNESDEHSDNNIDSDESSFVYELVPCSIMVALLLIN
eukprot:TRINITY_DN386_c0_g1_i1.p1 TRINITY_DN386_c0_g1~~TRINITY_DN386_c0_g1_i1.p1  ORF type:complete len:907 (+),score=179.00 TRINITY_DN386_c0_g1_i1:61-2781(+)